MRSILAAKCVKRTAPPQVIGDDSSDRDLVAWARDVIAYPQRHGADQRVSGIVADLLVRFEAGR